MLQILALVAGLAVARPAPDPPAAKPTPQSQPAPPQRLLARGLHPCEPPGAAPGAGALCGSFPVWENRATKQGRKIDLKLVVLPASGPSPAPDPLFYFMGGPGYAATEAASDLGDFLGGIRRERDLVFIDQRGMGGSNPLSCKVPGSDDDLQGFLRDLLPPAAVRACAQELAAKADLSQYSTAIAMEDIDEVRERLGYERINLFGGSYGTGAAEVYLRQHPEHVRSALLLGVMILDAKMPLFIARKAQDALDKLFDDCASDVACRAAFPDPRGDLAKALAQLDRGPVRQTIAHPKTGKEVTLALARGPFTTALRSMQYTAGKSISIPLYLHLAAQGDFRPMIREALRYFDDPGWYVGAYQAIVCPEDVDRIDRKEIAAQIRDTFLGDDRIRQQVESCEGWPRAQLPPGFFEPLRSTAPILLITGWLDPATPPEWAAEVQKTLPNSRNVLIRDAAHGPGGLQHVDCLEKMMTDFFHDGTPFTLDTTCVREMKRPPFALKLEG
jgi:pimeloyl-ACP methyl ester carboxylesterase